MTINSDNSVTINDISNVDYSYSEAKVRTALSSALSGRETQNRRAVNYLLSSQPVSPFQVTVASMGTVVNKLLNQLIPSILKVRSLQVAHANLWTLDSKELFTTMCFLVCSLIAVK